MARGFALLLSVLAALAVATMPGRAGASSPASSPVDAPELGAGPAGLPALVGGTIVRVEGQVATFSGVRPLTAPSVRVGETFTAEVARRLGRQVLENGGLADVEIRAEREGEGVALIVTAVERRLLASVGVSGGALDEEEVLRDAKLAVGDEITPKELEAAIARAEAYYGRHGFDYARVSASVRDTGEPLRAAVTLRVTPGIPRAIARRVMVHDGSPSPPEPALVELEGRYRVGAGDRADEEMLARADGDLTGVLRAAGYYQAEVSHQLLEQGGRSYLYVRIRSGPRYVVRFEGLRSFDADDLERALDLARESDRGVYHLASKISDFYVRRGFLDVEVEPEERVGSDDRTRVLYFRVREHQQVRVASRELSCLAAGPLTKTDARREIDTFLLEELPGGDIFGPVSPAEVDSVIGSPAFEGSRPTPVSLSPRHTYVAETYERASKHLQEYFRSQGYLSATVGPVTLLRRTCDRRSPAGRCVPLPLPEHPPACTYNAEGLPVDEPTPDRSLTCVPDGAHGITCEPRVSLRIPVKLGPRTMLYDVAFEGNRDLVERDLARAADLELGSPLSQPDLEAARRRVLDVFKEEGFAFAEVRTLLDFSPDHTRARARFLIVQRERVVVDDIVVRGAKRTDPALILGRALFKVCPRDRAVERCAPYRTSDVRATEERIATLGTFSSVAVSLEDPSLPARRKRVVLSVEERISQYVEPLVGFSTGEGFRGTLEYGHRNIAGKAIQLTLRTQLSYLPDGLILDPAVRTNYERLTTWQRIERRNSASIVFPETGLGPLFRLGIEGIDVRDNARDFGLTKQALLSTLTFRPVRVFYLQLGGSLERNDIGIFEPGQTLEAFLQAAKNPDLNRLLRAPQGVTYAIAQRFSVNWDQRDVPFGATRGTLVQGAVEHVHAYPAANNQNASVCPSSDGGTEPCPSDFLRLTGAVAGYVRLSSSGIALAASLRGGRIVHLMHNSTTYPDRLFFMGGVDSLRGFLQDSLVPEDIAQQLLHPGTSSLTIENVVLRGGDIFVNPRLELRIPLSGIWETGIFADSGNVWVDPKDFDPFTLRYTSGVGLRIATPIGPLAFDYGINLIRRPWEDRGNFHFSIGLF